jgi:urease accessory protein
MADLLPLLLLADGRFPAGGHAHSAGVEAAVADGRITDVDTLMDFVEGRLVTVGLTEAALAGATARRVAVAPIGAVAALLSELDREANARVPCPPLRDASRRLGRSLARAAAHAWPSTMWLALAEAAPGGAHQPVALGVACVTAGGHDADAVAIAVHHAINTPALAAVRLLGLDPIAVAAATASIGLGAGTDVMAAALAAASGELADLPATSGPLLDIAALEHRDRDVRMFAT